VQRLLREDQRREDQDVLRPLAGAHASDDRYVDEGGRVRILLSLIGFAAAVELESEQVSKL
jgi:hypothetical protein